MRRLLRVLVTAGAAGGRPCGRQARARCPREGHGASADQKVAAGWPCLRSPGCRQGLFIHLSGRHCWGPRHTPRAFHPLCVPPPASCCCLRGLLEPLQVQERRAGRAWVLRAPRAALSWGPGGGTRGPQCPCLGGDSKLQSSLGGREAAALWGSV